MTNSDSKNSTLYAGLLAMLLTAGTAAAPVSVPSVYQNEYIEVRAGIVETGMQPVHVGDALSLLVDIEFDAGQVQVENLNDDVFERAFAGVPGIRLYAPAVIDTVRLAQDRVRVSGQWRLQILDCPADLPSCPGAKSYELPVMTVAYRLIAHSGSAADSRSARFRPWPGTIAVAPAIAVMPQPGTKLADVLPGGAYAEPEPVTAPASASSLLLLAGAALFVTGFFATLRRQHPERAAIRPQHADARWRHALTGLGDAALRDEEWSDLLRRCITWYCMDELGRNPYAWLGAAASDAGDQTGSAMRSFFIDVLGQEGIDRDRRSEYLDRLQQLTNQTSSRERSA